MAKHVPIEIDESVKARFWAKVDVRGPDECWHWMNFKNRKGYGMFRLGRACHGAHRVSLVIAGFPAVPGEVADHICRNRSCVNPKHLRFVTPRVNTLENSEGTAAQNARKTHCKRGHPLSGNNLKINVTSGSRCCVTCMKAYDQMYIKLRTAKARALREQRQHAGLLPKCQAAA